MARLMIFPRKLHFTIWKHKNVVCENATWKVSSADASMLKKNVAIVENLLSSFGSRSHGGAGSVGFFESAPSCSPWIRDTLLSGSWIVHTRNGKAAAK